MSDCTGPGIPYESGERNGEGQKRMRKEGTA